MNSRGRGEEPRGNIGFIDVRDEHGHLLFRLQPELALIEIKPHRRGVVVVDLKNFLRLPENERGWTTLFFDV